MAAREDMCPGRKDNPQRKRYAMTRMKSLKAVIVVSVLAVAIGLGGRMLMDPPTVDAARLFKYKVVSVGSANTVYEYEKLLNDMAFQGWQFDHMVSERE